MGRWKRDKGEVREGRMGERCSVLTRFFRVLRGPLKVVLPPWDLANFHLKISKACSKVLFNLQPPSIS